MTIDLAAHLRTASLPGRTVPVCLRGDLLEVLLDAEEQLRRTMEDAARDLDMQRALIPADDEAAQKRAVADVEATILPVQDAVNAAQRAVEAEQIPFRLQALPPHEWTSLVTAHPPRPGQADDEKDGVNLATFPDALVRASLVDPKPTDAEWEQLRQVLHLSQMQALTDDATTLSRRQPVMTPFSFGASAPTPTSAPKPKKRAG
jgi:hypothetical protein